MERKNPVNKAISKHISPFNGCVTAVSACITIKNLVSHPVRRAIRSLSMLILVLVLITNSANAAIRTWVPAGGGAWTAANWGGTLPVNGDDLVINMTANGTITGVPSITLNSITIGGTANVIFTSAAGSTITIINIDATPALSIAAGRSFTLGGGAVASSVNLTFQTITTVTTISGTLINTANNIIIVDPSQTLTVAGTFTANVGTVTINGTLSNSGTVTGAGASLSFGSGAVYSHSRDGGSVPTATWDAASDCNIIGISGTGPSGFGQTFGNLTWNCGAQTVTANLNSTTTVNGTLGIQNTNNQIVRIAGSAATQTWSVNNFQQDGGIFSLSDQNGNSGSLFVMGTFVQNGGTITKSGNNIGNEVRLSGASDVTPVLDGAINSTGTNPIRFSITKGANSVFMPAYSFDASTELRITSGTLDFGSATKIITVNGNFNMSGGTILMDGASNNKLDLKGAVAWTAGSLGGSCSDDEIIYSGAAQNILPFNYCNLTINGTGVKTMLGAITVNNNLIIGGSATLYSNTFQITGNATGVFTMANGTGLQLGNIGSGNNIQFPSNYSTANITLNSGSTVTYQSNANQTISGVPAYGNLTIATGGIKTLTGGPLTTIIQGALTINAGTFNLGTTTTTVNVGGNVTAVPGTSGLTFGVSVPQTINITGDLNGAGTINLSGGGLTHRINLAGNNNCTGTFTAGSSTFDYNGTDQIVRSIFGANSYYNLDISNSGVKTFSNSAVNINGALNINGASTTIAFTNAAAQIVTVVGNLSGTGTIDISVLPARTHTLNLGGATNNIGSFLTDPAVASVVNYNRAGVQTIFTSTNYRNLTISNGSNKSLQGDIIVGGTLTLTSGKIVLGTNNLTLTGVAAVGGAGAANYIVADGTGQLKKTIAIGGPFGAYVLPVGDAINYSPVSLTFTSNTISARNIGVRVTDAVHPNDGGSSDNISRYWSFTDDQSGVGTYLYNASFTFISPADLTGVYANLRVNRWNGLSWTQYTTSGVSPTITVTGVTEITSPLNNNDFTGRATVPLLIHGIRAEQLLTGQSPITGVLSGFLHSQTIF